MADSIEDQTPETRVPAATIGMVLREARESRNLTVEDIHNRLRISLRQITALENDDYAVLPEATITRGFIRNYAKLLDIDAEPLLNAYKSAVHEPEHKSISIPSANILISKREAVDWKKYIYAACVIVLCVFGWLVYNDAAMHSFVMSATSSLSTPSASPKEQEHPLPEQETPQEPMPVPALPHAERVPDSQEDNAVPQPAPEQPAATTTQSAPAAANPPSNVVQPVNPESAVVKPDETAPAAGGTAKLSMSFNEDCWVSVIDRNNKEIYNKNKRAGSQDEVTGDAPFKVIVGNAGGVQVSYNGKAVDLGPYTRLNVARFILE